MAVKSYSLVITQTLKGGSGWMAVSRREARHVEVTTAVAALAAPERRPSVLRVPTQLLESHPVALSRRELDSRRRALEAEEPANHLIVVAPGRCARDDDRPRRGRTVGRVHVSHAPAVRKEVVGEIVPLDLDARQLAPGHREQ